MFGEISLPVWIFIVLLFGTLVSIYRYVVFPIVAAYLNTRSRMVVDEVNPHLQLKLSQFTLARRLVLADRLASDDQVEAALEGFAKVKGLSKEQIRRATWRMAWDIVPAFNPYFYFRVGYRIARACLRALYKVRIVFEDEASMASVSDESAVIFVINHRSNIDYAVANYLTSRRTILSFGVGEWSRVWPIQPVMRMAGGYFVRRNSGDPHYRLLLKRYVQLATKAKVPHAIFLEGELSKDGGVNRPRVGLLSYVTEEFDPGKGHDIVLIPIGLNYDWVIEDIHVTRFSSQDFQMKGRAYTLIQGMHFLGRVLYELVWRRQRFGLHCSKFGRPVSFRSWLEERGSGWVDLDRSERYGQIQALGDRLIGDVARLVPATPMAVLCRIWFDDPECQLTEEQAHDRFIEIGDTLRANGCHVERIGRRDSDDAPSFRHALGMALERGMLTRDQGGRLSRGKDAARLVNYYANSITQHLR